jgi:rare lipoprotein A (peptidoglycan hydrolase)
VEGYSGVIWFTIGSLAGGLTSVVLIALFMGLEDKSQESKIEAAFQLGLSEGKRRSKSHSCSDHTASVVSAGSPSTDSYPIGWTQTGVASWYGDPFHGRLTASGEVYDMDLMTAAHQALPFGTRIRVDNRDNNRSIELVVNDRGPFVKNRILDVSRAGARALDMIEPGTARVLITILKPGGDLVSVQRRSKSRK